MILDFVCKIVVMDIRLLGFLFMVLEFDRDRVINLKTQQSSHLSQPVPDLSHYNLQVWYMSFEGGCFNAGINFRYREAFMAIVTVSFVDLNSFIGVSALDYSFLCKHSFINAELRPLWPSQGQFSVKDLLARSKCRSVPKTHVQVISKAACLVFYGRRDPWPRETGKC